MKDKPRIGTATVTDRTEIYNANYSPSNNRIGNFENPWTVIGPSVFKMHPTHAAALAYAIESLTPDPAPESRASVTLGWAPKPSQEDAWNEKWELTR